MGVQGVSFRALGVQLTHRLHYSSFQFCGLYLGSQKVQCQTGATLEPMGRALGVVGLLGRRRRTEQVSVWGFGTRGSKLFGFGG